MVNRDARSCYAAIAAELGYVCADCRQANVTVADRLRAPDAAQRSCGALQSRGRNETRRLVRSRFCEAALKKRCIAPGTQASKTRMSAPILTAIGAGALLATGRGRTIVIGVGAGERS